MAEDVPPSRIDPDLVGNQESPKDARKDKEKAEQRYTLKEAEETLKRRHCARYGHTYVVDDHRPLRAPAGIPFLVKCTNCSESWKVELKVVM